MQKAGADRVFTGEGEVALGLIETILERLGATAEQIDRERERAHRELFGKEPAESPAEHEMKPKLEPQIDELYTLPLDAFTKARNALAKTLSGDDKKADRVARQAVGGDVGRQSALLAGCAPPTRRWSTHRKNCAPRIAPR